MTELYQYVLDHQEQLSSIALGVILVARMIAALTPSKRDDEIASSIEKGLRKGIELVSGAGHKNLITAQPETLKDADQDDPFEALAALVDKFEGKIIIVPKERK